MRLLKLTFLFLFSFIAFAQDLQEELLRSLTQAGESSLFDSQNLLESQGDERSYDYFTKNFYDSTVKQLEVASSISEEEYLKTELEKKRRELAVQLCEKDERACFLIENYRDSVSKAKNDELQNKLFGVEIFSGYPLNFQSVPQGGLGGEYVLKIGDILEVSIVGSASIKTDVEVNREGYIVIPNLGSFFVAGMPLSLISEKFKDFVDSKRPGSLASLFIKRISPIQIFTVGAVNFPGSYNLGGTSTPINAIISSGGFLENSSLRRIEVIRKNQPIKEIDLYELLVRGNNEEIQLSNGDSVVVRGVESIVRISGAVNRPSKYEIKDGETVKDVIEFALGFTPDASQSGIVVQRETSTGQKTTLEVDDPSSFRLNANDEILVRKSSGETLNFVSLSGAIRTEGIYPLDREASLSDYVNIETDLLANTYPGFLLIKRFNKLSRTYSIKKNDLYNLEKIKIFPRDEIFFFSWDDISFLNSQKLLAHVSQLTNKGPINNIQAATSNFNLTHSSNQDFQNNSITETYSKNDESCLSSMSKYSDKNYLVSMLIKLSSIESKSLSNCSSMLNKNPDLLPILLANSVPAIGSLRRPGLYPLGEASSGRELLEFAGGPDNINEENITIEVGNEQGIKQLRVDELSEIQNIVFLNSKRNINASRTGYVTIIGEFNYPGVYPISGPTRLSEIYKRSQGVTENAYPAGAILTRKSIRLDEERALNRSLSEIANILTTAITAGYLSQNSTDVIQLVNLMKQIESAKPTGRLVAELHPTILYRDKEKDILVQDGDVLYMPQVSNTVTIMGEVLNPVTIPHGSDKDFIDYINIAGGFKNTADKKRVYAILPNGESINFTQTSIFNRQSSYIMPGSAIIVPKQARPLSGLSLVEVMTPILANLSVTAASIAAISNNN